MSSYKTILKTTGLFAYLRVLSIILNVGTSKLIAIFVGASGIGLYGIYTSVLTLITSISDLGISKSSVRNIAAAEGSNNKEETQKAISIVSKLIYLTGAIGGLITIIFSFQISKWSLGNSSYWLSFIFLGISVFFTVIKNGQSAIFQGLRNYKLISKSTIYGSLISFAVSVPLIYFLKGESIMYVILLNSFIAFIISQFYLKKIVYNFSIQNVKLTRKNSADLIKLGLSMMLVSFLVAFSGYVIRAYITNYGSINDLGYFQAGFQIISGYFGIIFMSMTTDFFPRISAIQNDNTKLNQEVNQQATITLLLICPLVVILPFIMPYVINILYTGEFHATQEYVNIALFGIIFQASSQIMGMIPLAKNNARVYLIYVASLQFICLIINIVGYRYMGIFGLGATFTINMLLQLLSIMLINKYKYSIKFESKFFEVFFVVLILALISYLFKDSKGIYFCVFSILNLVVSITYVTITFKKLLNISSIISLIKLKFLKNQ